MIKIGDVIPCVPDSKCTPDLYGKTATVVFIHPAGRFYVVRFDFARGSYCETKYFTEDERLEGLNCGYFIEGHNSLTNIKRYNNMAGGSIEEQIENIMDMFG